MIYHKEDHPSKKTAAILGLFPVGIFLLAVSAWWSYVGTQADARPAQAATHGAAYYLMDVRCIEGYKFAVVMTNSHNAIAITQIYKKYNDYATPPQPMPCKE